MQPTGADIRALRKTRGLTLADLSAQLGRSIGWLSQVERDQSIPDPDDLAALASALDAPFELVPPKAKSDADQGVVVRANRRWLIEERVPGLTEYLLSPDLTDGFEVIHSTFAPGARRDDPVIRQTIEIVHLLSGTFCLTIEGHRYDLAPGDTARLRGESFTWANEGGEHAVALWLITPALYSKGSL